MAGLYMAVGVLRLGFLTNFLSHSVLSGFTTGAAAVIGIAQARLAVAPHLPPQSCALASSGLSRYGTWS